MNRETNKVVETRTVKVVDNRTGEITNEVETQIKALEREPNYVKLYLDQIVKLSEITGWTSNVLYELLGDSKYANEGQIIVVNAGYKEMVAEKLGIKPQSVTNAINALKKKEIIYKVKNGVFQLNPRIFGKGEWKDVKRLRYEVELSEQGTKITLKEKVMDEPKSAENLSEELLKNGDNLTQEQRYLIQQIINQKVDNDGVIAQ